MSNGVASPPVTGRISASQIGGRATFSTLSYTYPLKLISPRSIPGLPSVLQCYMLSYGGGLVCGDEISLDVEVMDACRLVLMTQGSTKVFRVRPGRGLPSGISLDSAPVTHQRMTINIAAEASLCLLPAPVTCFESARYRQYQRVTMTSQASLLLLDWFTSGRMSRGEQWLFDEYRSTNEIWIDGKRFAKDVLLLKDESQQNKSRPDPNTGAITITSDPTLSPATSSRHRSSKRQTSFAVRMGTYGCYATLLIVGPTFDTLRMHLSKEFQAITQYRQKQAEFLLWSVSTLDSGKVTVVRCAAQTTEQVRDWLKDVMEKGGVADVIGAEALRAAFA